LRKRINSFSFIPPIKLGKKAKGIFVWSTVLEIPPPKESSKTIMLTGVG